MSSGQYVYLGCCPLPVTVTTRIITCLKGNPYKPSFATVTVRGPHPMYTIEKGERLELTGHCCLLMLFYGLTCETDRKLSPSNSIEVVLAKHSEKQARILRTTRIIEQKSMDHVGYNIFNMSTILKA